MEPNHPHGRLSRRRHDWRGARELVIEGEARVVSRTAGAGPRPAPAASAPRWGAALDAAAALAPTAPRLARLAVPAGLALAALAVFALSPAEAERHGAGEPAVRVAAAPVLR
ncbi:hypothetical protein D3218_11915 [Aureimonas flava]|uniref:Uncharacterized protein n=1 Tax=Aureimonas flava TaxID=2320271 RepID=A0A3A1WHD9_9HYPH|nr:hypothetical protein [Aureimonas flava]RIY00004.1 hypothetical protein D3218_11915 [Aureimonas flava]